MCDSRSRTKLAAQSFLAVISLQAKPKQVVSRQTRHGVNKWSSAFSELSLSRERVVSSNLMFKDTLQAKHRPISCGCVMRRPMRRGFVLTQGNLPRRNFTTIQNMKTTTSTNTALFLFILGARGGLAPFWWPPSDHRGETSNVIYPLFIRVFFIHPTKDPFRILFFSLGQAMNESCDHRVRVCPCEDLEWTKIHETSRDDDATMPKRTADCVVGFLILTLQAWLIHNF